MKSLVIILFLVILVLTLIVKGVEDLFKNLFKRDKDTKTKINKILEICNLNNMLDKTLEFVKEAEKASQEILEDSIKGLDKKDKKYFEYRKKKENYKKDFNTNLYVDYKSTSSNASIKRFMDIPSYGTFIPNWLYNDVYSVVNEIVEDKGSVLELDLLGLYYFYHITHIENLESILYHGLRNHNNVYRRVRIDNVDLNERGAYKKVYGRNIHEYVRMYINFRNAMLYKNKNENVVLLGIGNRIVNLYPKERIVFSDRNSYANKARFSNNYLCLKDETFINLDNVFSSSWKNNEYIKQVMMSEVMVYDKIYTKNIDFIVIKESSQIDRVSSIVKGKIPIVVVNEYSKVFFGV